jgi:hypothetical protein
MELPIDPEIIKKRAYLPVKLSELSKIDPDAALKYLRNWGDGKQAISQLWDSVMSELNSKQSLQ